MDEHYNVSPLQDLTFASCQLDLPVHSSLTSFTLASNQDNSMLPQRLHSIWSSNTWLMTCYYWMSFSKKNRINQIKNEQVISKSVEKAWESYKGWRKGLSVKIGKKKKKEEQEHSAVTWTHTLTPPQNVTAFLPSLLNAP